MPHPLALEATVTSKGQITLPKMLRERTTMPRTMPSVRTVR